jgi:NAD(P)-dependent dehydrogenase (short-subunit alcohol dehydrogenase family)
MPLTGIRGKVIMITGGASGIGLATATMFAKEGAKIAIVTGHSIQKAEDTVKELKSMGAEAIFIQCDVRNENQVDAMLAKAIDYFGKIDFAFNNAGVGPEGVTIPLLPLTDLDKSYWDLIIDTNLTGVFLCLKHELRQMRKQGHGVIVNTSSRGSLRVLPNFGGYGPSKAAVNFITKLAAEENKDKNIRVHAVCPGMIQDTGLTDRLKTYETKRMAEKISGGASETGFLDEHGNLRNAGQPEDIANLVLFLCSDQASFVDGSVTLVAGTQSII